MKRVKVLMLIGLLQVTGVSLHADTTSLSQRVEHLEKEKTLRDQEFQMDRNRYQLEFQTIKKDSDSESTRIWVAIAAGLAILGVSIMGTIKLAKNHAERIVLNKLEKDLPPMVQQRMEDRFDTLLRKHSKIILNLVGMQDRIEGFKRNKRILILCEDNEDCQKMENLIRGIMGFENAKAKVADTFEGADQYDLVVIAREDSDHTRYEKLTGQAIWDFLMTLPEDKVALYYGPRFERLDSEVREKIQFSNIVFTIYARIVEVFEYQHVLGEWEKGQASNPNPQH